MSRVFNPLAIWSQVPLAKRTASVVKSIQFISGSYTAAASNSFTIASVDTSKSFALHTSAFLASATMRPVYGYDFASATSLRIYHHASASDDTQYFTVVEFY